MSNEDLERSLMGKSPFDALYGLEVTSIDAEGARGRIEVAPQLCQPTGIVHGGVYSAIAEALASGGTNWAVAERGEVGFGMSNNTSFLRPVSAGTLEAEATPVHSGRTTWVWDVRIADGEDRTCAVSRVTIAVRPRPGA